MKLLLTYLARIVLLKDVGKDQPKGWGIPRFTRPKRMILPIPLASRPTDTHPPAPKR